MKIFCTSLLIVASLFGAVAANASSVSYSATSGSFSASTSVGVSKFNSSLGTLTGVLVEGSFTGSSSVIFTDTGSNDMKVVSTAMTQGIEFADANGHSTSPSANTTQYSGVRFHTGESVTLSSGTLSASSSFSLTASEALSAGYVGSGSVLFDLSNIVGASPTTVLYGASGTHSYNTSLSGTAVGTVKVTYTYTPIAPVPEPSSWLLSLGGLAGLSGLGMMRQRKAA